MNTPTNFKRQAIRAAVRIHQQLIEPARDAQSWNLPHSDWDGLCQIVQRLQFVERKGWQAASQSLQLDVDYAIGRLESQLEAIRQRARSSSISHQVASAGEIAADLFALEEEIDEVSLDLSRKSVSVVTSPIVLEGVDLGPFRIVLEWPGIGQGHPYRVYAMAPSHLNGRTDVTHPHVLDHQLCEGDGTAAIKAALTTGRLYDFFVLVRQILRTYNPDSAHVSLSNWDGSMSCDGCGTSMLDDEYSTCERCDERFCSDCSWICNDCSRTVCSGCSDFCDRCHERFCQSCLTTPDHTTRLLCGKCFAAQSQEPLHEKKDNPSDQTAVSPPQVPAATAAPEADAVRVGQVGVPARSGRNGSRRIRHQPARRTTPRRRRAAG